MAGTMIVSAARVDAQAPLASVAPPGGSIPPFGAQLDAATAQLAASPVGVGEGAATDADAPAETELAGGASPVAPAPIFGETALDRAAHLIARLAVAQPASAKDIKIADTPDAPALPGDEDNGVPAAPETAQPVAVPMPQLRISEPPFPPAAFEAPAPTVEEPTRSKTRGADATHVVLASAAEPNLSATPSIVAPGASPMAMSGPPGADLNAVMTSVDASGIERHVQLAGDSAWLDDLARDIAVAGADRGRVQFALGADALGQLDFDVINDDAGMTLRITAHDQVGHESLAAAHPRLVDELKHSGLRVSAFELGPREIGMGASPGGSAGGSSAQRSLPQPMIDASPFKNDLTGGTDQAQNRRPEGRFA